MITDEYGRRLVAAIALHPDAVAGILADHRPDEHGRCAGCMLDARMRPPWPCGLRGLAEKAADNRAWLAP